MLFGLDGVELSLIISFATLFLAILSGFPVAFAIAGSAALSFAIIAVLSANGWLYVTEEIRGVTEQVPVLTRGWDGAVLSTLSTWSQGVFARAFGGNVETLLAVPLFVLMGIALERSRIAEDLLTTMARTFGAMPGGLAISVVLVGALLAASTGVVGATVVTMGLIALPTMLRAGYSKSLSTGVIATSGTLGQIIPPSIVLVLLGSIVGDMYAIGQENRAAALDTTVIEMLGEPAVLSTGTLFKAAFIPGVVLALLYALYAFGYAWLRPDRAPPIREPLGSSAGDPASEREATGGSRPEWAYGVPVALVIAWILGTLVGAVDSTRDAVPTAVSHGVAATVVGLGALGALAYGLRPLGGRPRALWSLGAGLGALLLVDVLLIRADTSAGVAFLHASLPAVLIVMGLRDAIGRLATVPVIRVVSPPVILIVSVLGSILGGITSPTPAAALGAAGAILLAAARLAGDDRAATRVVLWTAFAVIVLLLLRGNFDLRLGIKAPSFEDRVAIAIALMAYHVAVFGLLFACWVLVRRGVMGPVVRETTKVTNMVFLILIASLFLSLTIRSYGGEHYIQESLRAIEDPRHLLLVVMGVLFLLGFVLDFIEIIFIVIPIVGPVIYAADPALMPPEWITILIAVNLQTSFITPPFGFALFYLRGVAPPSITTADIYRGIWPFVLIQVAGLVLLWHFPIITTLLPTLLPQG